MIPHCRCGHGEGLTRIVLRLTSTSLSVEAQCGFDVGVPQRPLNDSWRGSGVSERCAESIAESMEAQCCELAGRAFRARPETELDDMGTLPRPAFSVREQQTLWLFRPWHSR